MLILSRKIGERFLIGEDIVVQVLNISGTHVKLGVIAPKNTKIFREELLDTTNKQTITVSTMETL